MTPELSRGAASTWADRRCPKCGRVAYVPKGAFCTFHANQRVEMEDTRA